MQESLEKMLVGVILEAVSLFKRVQKHLGMFLGLYLLETKTVGMVDRAFIQNLLHSFHGLENKWHRHSSCPHLFQEIK